MATQSGFLMKQLAEGAQTAMPGADSAPGAAYDVGTLFVLMVTVFGFVVPMLLVYPPVAPRPSDFLNETHSRMGGEEAEADGQADGQVDGGDGRIAGIRVYPIAACSGIRLSRSRVLATGLEFDGVFSFAQLRAPFPARAGEVVGGSEDPDDKDDAVWDVLAAPQFARLATLQVELWRPDQAKAKRVQERMRADDRAERAATLGESYVLVRYPWGPVGGLAGLWACVAAKLARGWRAVPEVEVVVPVAAAGTADQTGVADRTGRTGNAPSGCLLIGRDVVRALDLSAELPPSLQLFLGVSNRLGLFRTDAVGLGQVAAVQDRSVRLSVLAKDNDRANITLAGVSASDKDSWRTILFRPSSLPGADDDLAARFRVDQDGEDCHQMTPVFAQTDRPELQALTLDVGMTVDVLERVST